MPIKKMIIAAVFIGVIFGLSSFVFAQGTSDNYGLYNTARKTKLFDLGISKSAPEILAARIVTAALGFTGAIFFLLVLYGGITWMMAMGSSEKVDKAKTILTTAVIGLIIVVASYAISMFVFNRLTASNGTIGCCQYLRPDQDAKAGEYWKDDGYTKADCEAKPGYQKWTASECPYD